VKAKTILIIEDDDDILQVLETILIHVNYHVVGINKTDDIIKSIEKYNPDIVITDFLLNGLHGGRICQAIKSNSVTRHIPVVLISAFIDFANIYGDFGFDAIISKPFELVDIVRTIKRL
jgi:two-component system phosphate regulon response regulator PhoB